MDIACGSLIALHALQAGFTLLPLSRSETWWIRSLDFPRLQLVCFAGVLVVADVLSLYSDCAPAKWLFGIAAASLLYHVAWIAPYTRLYPKMVEDASDAVSADSRLRVLIVNILMQNRRAEGLIEQVRAHDPDVLIVSEPDAWWQGRLDVLEPSYPYTIKCPLDNCYGMLLYSRLPLKDVAVQYLVDDDVPSIHGLLSLRSGEVVRLHAVHPRPPVPTERSDSSARDAELVVLGRSVAESKHPVIVAGDLNDVAWSTTTKLFLKVSELLDPRVGRGMFNSFHAEHRWLRWPLDHLFHSRHFALVEIRRLAAFGSDHFPILVELALDPRIANEHEALSSSPSDEQAASEKAAAKGVEPDDVHTPGE